MPEKQISMIRASQNAPKINKLKPSERQELKDTKERVLNTYRQKVAKEFNGETNWSILMSQEDNNVRN